VRSSLLLSAVVHLLVKHALAHRQRQQSCTSEGVTVDSACFVLVDTVHTVHRANNLQQRSCQQQRKVLRTLDASVLSRVLAQVHIAHTRSCWRVDLCAFCCYSIFYLAVISCWLLWLQLTTCTSPQQRLLTAAVATTRHKVCCLIIFVVLALKRLVNLHCNAY
jgi:hypothetical protein